MNHVFSTDTVLIPSIEERQLCIRIQQRTHIVTPEIADTILAYVKLPKILEGTGAKQTTIQMLLEGCQHILLKEKRNVEEQTEARFPTNSTCMLLLTAFGIHRLDVLLTALLRDVFYEDIFSAIQVAHLFGDDVCLMVDLVTRCSQNRKIYAQNHADVVDRFNSASSEGEIKIMTTVVLVLTAEKILLLGCPLSSGLQSIFDAIERTRKTFAIGLLNKLDLNHIPEETADHIRVMRSSLFRQIEILEYWLNKRMLRYYANSNGYREWG